MKTKILYRRPLSPAFALLITLLCSSPLALRAATISVTSLSDSGAGTLRAAIASAVDGDTIVFTVSGTNPVSTVGDSTYGPSSYVITNTVTIDANGAVIARDPSVSNLRLFYITPTGNLTLNSATLRDGQIAGGNGGSGFQRGGSGGGAAGLGGAIYNQGTLAIENTTLTANQAIGGNGGGGTPTDGLGSGGGGGGLNADGGAGGAASTGGDGGDPNGGTGGTNTGGGTDGGIGGGGGGGGSGGGGNGSGAGGNGGFGAGGGGGGAYDTAGNPGGMGGTGGNGGFGGGGGSGGAGTPDGTAGIGGFGGGSGTNGFDNGNIGGDGGGGAGIGGAIFNDAGTLTVTNSTISLNLAQGGDGNDYFNPAQGGGGFGAGIFNRNGSVVIQNSHLDGNMVVSGSGGTPVPSLGSGLYNYTLDTASLSISKQQAKLNFAKSDSDSLSLTASLDLGTDFNPTNEVINLDVDGATAVLTLDEKGTAATAKGVVPSVSIKLALKKTTGLWILTAKFNHGSWSQSWNSLGFVNGNVPKPGSSVTLPVLVQIEDVSYEGQLPLTYTAKAGKSGSAK